MYSLRFVDVFSRGLSGDFIVSGLEVLGGAPVLPCKPWPNRAVDTVRVEVPTGASTLGPYALGEFLLNVFVEMFLNLGPHVDALRTATRHSVNGLHDVLDLLFDHEHDRIVSQSGVGAEEEKQVGEALGCDAEMGASASAGHRPARP